MTLPKGLSIVLQMTAIDHGLQDARRSVKFTTTWDKTCCNLARSTSIMMSITQPVTSPQNSSQPSVGRLVLYNRNPQLQVPAEDDKAGFLNCGTCAQSGRCLVVCIDGTSKKFGAKNSNVIELYSQILKNERQLTYYNSGIGTYVKPTVFHPGETVYSWADRIFAFNFKRTIIDAYRWLSENYQQNDRIYLFGFSRGAYQVRALAGMLYKVGLIYKGNKKQIPFAYDLYVNSHYTPPLSRAMSAPEDLAPTFKKAFAWDSVHIHFVGVWDTVSSVGIGRKKSLPYTNSVSHICFFRHALALDERRVKFLPEYVHVGMGPTPEESRTQTGTGVAIPKVKEVWFPGTHSDIGGGNRENLKLTNGDTPLLWMSYEAQLCDLELETAQIGWNWETIGKVQKSLGGILLPLEAVPITRLVYTSEDETTFWKPHWGSGRQIHPYQKIHASIAFCPPDYRPRAKFAQRDLQTLVNSGTVQNMDWANSWKDVVEMDIFDHSTIKDVLAKLASASNEAEARFNLHRLMVTTWSQEGLEALKGVDRSTSSKLVDLLKHDVKVVQLSAAQALGVLSDKYNLADIGQGAIRPLCDMYRDPDLKDDAAKTLCCLLGGKYRVDLPRSYIAQTAKVLRSIFSDKAQEPNVRLHSLHALIRNRYGDVRKEILQGGLKQDVMHCLRHNNCTDSTVGIFLDIASHPEFGEAMDMDVIPVFFALIEGTEFHKALVRFFELYDKFRDKFKRRIVGPQLGTIVKNAFQGSCGLQLLNSIIPLLKHREVRVIVIPEIVAVFKPWLEGDEFSIKGNSFSIDEMLETVLRCINQEAVLNKFINENIIKRLATLLGQSPVIKSWALANLSHMVEAYKIPEETLDRMSRAIEVLLVDDNNKIFERALGSTRQCFDCEYVRTRLIQNGIFDRLDRDALFHRSINVKFGLVNMFSLGVKDGNLSKYALENIALAMRELLRHGDNRTLISALRNAESWWRHEPVRSKLIQGGVFDDFGYLFGRSQSMTAWSVRILSLVIKNANIAGKVLDRIAPAIKELLCSSDDRTVMSALTYTRSWLRHEHVRTKLIEERIFDKFDSLFDHSADMKLSLVGILALVMKDGNIAESTLNLIPSAIKSLLQGCDAESVVSILITTELWLEDNHVRPKLLQERVFDELESLFDRLADMSLYFVRILSVMKDDISERALNQIAPAIKKLLCNSDDGIVISALTYTRSWLEHKHVRTKLIQERIFDNFNTLFDRSPDMKLSLVGILALVMKDGRIAQSTLDLIPSSIMALLHNNDNGIVISALMLTYLWLEHEHVRFKLIQEGLFETCNILDRSNSMIKQLVVYIQSHPTEQLESSLKFVHVAVQTLDIRPDSEPEGRSSAAQTQVLGSPEVKSEEGEEKSNDEESVKNGSKKDREGEEEDSDVSMTTQERKERVASKAKAVTLWYNS